MTPKESLPGGNQAGDGRERKAGDLLPNDSTGAPSAQASANELARVGIRKILAGNPPNGLDASQCGPWAGAVADLIDAYGFGGYDLVKKSWELLAHKTPELARLVAGDGPLAGATAKVRRLARVPDQVDLPGIDDAQSLADLAEFTAAIMTAGTVSYTHLDVYKRQAKSARASR